TSWCDQVINGLPEPIARAALTMLVRPADPVHHIPAVRRQRRLADLREAAEGADEVLAGLIDGRVIVTSVSEPAGEGVADLAHDALIDRWVTLREWVKQDADYQKWLLRAEERQQLWTNRNDPADLLSGYDLAEGQQWSARRRLPHDVANLLTISQDHHH